MELHSVCAIFVANNDDMEKIGNTGLVLEGGAMRGMFSAGVMDVLMEHGLWFSYVNGVSGCCFRV